MTSREDEIKKLIADIDNLLTSSGKRLPKLLSSQAQEPREVLERIRYFLVQLVRNETLESDTQNKSTEQLPRSPLLTKFVDQGQNQSSALQNQLEPEQTSFTPQHLKSEFSVLLQPLQAELAAMLQERANLIQEIRQLEQKRLHNYSLSQQWANQEQMISEFLQVLMNRLVPNLTPQMAQNLASSHAAVNHSSTESTPSATQPFLESSDQAERLTQLARELDQRLLSLDGTVNVVFEALQRNINTYHESLSQTLARMHSMGVQGEQLMASLLNNLTQHLPPQAPTARLSLLEAEKATPPRSLLSNQTSTSTTTEVSEQPWESSESEPLADNLDAVLSQLSEDAPLSANTETISEELQPDSLELIGDQVDQLYASLFGNDSFSYPSSAVNELSSPIADTELTPVNEPVSEVDSDDTIPEPVDSAIATPDPWLNKPEIGLFNLNQINPQITQNPLRQTTDSALESWEALFSEDDDDLALPIGFPDFLQEEFLATDSFSTQPNIADTITTLTDLFDDFEEPLSEVAFPSVAADFAPVNQSLEVVIDNDEKSEPSLENYIAASPQENLLSPENIQPTNVVDISLDEEQLQQLHQDLANFDEQISASLTSENIVDDSVSDRPTPNNTTFAFSHRELPKIVPISLPQTEADLDFSPTIEKKKEAPTSGQDDSVAPTNTLDSIWYLGLDLGTTGISATLLNRSTFVVHPIYWSAENQPELTSFQQSFRLPAEVYLPAASTPHSETEINPQKNLYSAQLKPYLQIALPYKNTQQKWEPVLQFNEFSAGPLVWVVRSLSKLLLTLKSDRQSTTQGLIATAVGLNSQVFSSIINNIAGVICTCPSNWSEQYRFNVREALLTSKLVQHPQQVFFIEEAIASLLSTLNASNGETIKISEHQDLRPVNTSDRPLIGNTLAVNIGATTTEMALVELPENLLQLTHQDFMLHGFTYASKGIEQDIICQLLVPTKYRQPRPENPVDDQIITDNPWQWQPTFPGLEQMQWQSLGLETLDLPKVGEPDITARIRLQQRLESSLLGQALLDAALALKLSLQHQNSFYLELGDQRWVLQRRDLENQVFVPFVRRLNRELNKLLVARGIPTEAINQAILTGGVASLGVVSNWLRQKLPNAKIIHDSYLGENGAPNCSRVAYGLAMLPLHPQVLETSKQQYTDYFLFTELLRLLPDRTLSFSEVLQLFEGCGINTSICQQRLLAFLEGELPPGLIPSALDTTWLTRSSQQNADYQAIASAPLFDKQGNLTYRPNSQQILALRHYLDTMKASVQQSLEEPYTVNFASQIDR